MDHSVLTVLLQLTLKEKANRSVNIVEKESFLRRQETPRLLAAKVATLDIIYQEHRVSRVSLLNINQCHHSPRA